ncbi:MAG: class I SAM-dependent methyltransferase [Roseovarius sp.]
MSGDDQTLAVYNSQTEEYAAMMAREAAEDPMIGRFIAACPPGGRVLDLGCGTGHYAKIMAEAGLAVEAMDAAEQMVARAAQVPGVKARLGRFEDLDAQDAYDGIWAYFSLLHAPRAEMPGHLARIAFALRPGGTLFLCMKRGQAGKRDSLGRYYEYYEREDLEALLRDAGLTPQDHWFGKTRGMAGHLEGWVLISAHA